MGFIQERILNIALGVSKEYHLFQFSDVHVVTYRPTDSAESIEKAINQEKTWMTQRLDFARKFHEPFDSEHLLPSTECLGNLIDYANQNNPDLVLLTGDIVDYYSEANHDFLKQSLMKIKSPYLFSIGNHESPSIRFEDLCQGKSDFAAFDLGEFFVVSIDDSKRRISAFQREAFARLLTLNKPIIIACHVPMVTRHNEAVLPKFDSYFTMSYQDCDEITGDFIDLVCSSDQVKAVLCGHIHGAMASFIAPDKPQYCCSSGLIGSVNKIIIR